MAKATIEYDLPDEAYDLEVALKGLKLVIFLWDLKQEFRGKAKYGQEKPEDWYEVYDLYNQMLADSGLADLVEDLP